MIMGGFMAGMALGQQLVGMQKGKGRRKSISQNLHTSRLLSSPMNQRLKSAEMAAYKRMKNHQKVNFTQNNVAMKMPNMNNQNAGYYKFNDDASGMLLNSFRNSISEFNNWIKRQSNGLLDLNVTFAIFFIARGIRKFVLEKQYPSAWQLIWWASSILKGWRFM